MFINPSLSVFCTSMLFFSLSIPCFRLCHSHFPSFHSIHTLPIILSSFILSSFHSLFFSFSLFLSFPLFLLFSHFLSYPLYLFQSLFFSLFLFHICSFPSICPSVTVSLINLSFFFFSSSPPVSQPHSQTHKSQKIKLYN